MKKEVDQISELELLKNYPITGTTVGWYFKLEEMSQGAWHVKGSDRWGRKLYRQGGDPDLLLKEAEQEAKQINQEILDSK